MSFCKGFTQGGSNADIVVADAYIKNLTEGIDWDLAYEAVLSDAEGKPHLLLNRRRFACIEATHANKRCD